MQWEILTKVLLGISLKILSRLAVRFFPGPPPERNLKSIAYLYRSPMPIYRHQAMVDLESYLNNGLIEQEGAARFLDKFAPLFDTDFPTRRIAARLWAKLAVEYRFLLDKPELTVGTAMYLVKKGSVSASPHGWGGNPALSSLAAWSWVSAPLKLYAHSPELRSRVHLLDGELFRMIDLLPHEPGYNCSKAQGLRDKISEEPAATTQDDICQLERLGCDWFWFTRAVVAGTLAFLVHEPKVARDVNKRAEALLNMLLTDGVLYVRQAAQLARDGIVYPDEGEVIAGNPAPFNTPFKNLRAGMKVRDGEDYQRIVRFIANVVDALNLLSALAESRVPIARGFERLSAGTPSAVFEEYADPSRRTAFTKDVEVHIVERAKRLEFRRISAAFAEVARDAFAMEHDAYDYESLTKWEKWNYRTRKLSHRAKARFQRVLKQFLEFAEYLPF